MIVGIDLGTTNSLIAAWVDGAPQLIPNAQGTYLTPSLISMDSWATSPWANRPSSNWTPTTSFPWLTLNATWARAKCSTWDPQLSP